MACHYRVADEGREGRPAGSAARHHPGRRRHAAAAAACRRGAGARDVHRRQAGAGAARRSPPASSIRSSTAICWPGAIAFAKAQGGGRRDSQDARDRRSRADGAAAGLEACERARASPGEDRQGRCARRSPPSTRIEAGADAAVRRRARSASASCSPTASSRPSRRRCGTCSSPSARRPRCPTSRRTRRRTDIRRAAVVGAGTMGGGIAMTLRERRHPGAAQGGGRCGAAARAGDHPQELRVDDVEGQDDRRGSSSKTMALITPTTTYDGFDRWTSSSKRCSRTWT